MLLHAFLLKYAFKKMNCLKLIVSLAVCQAAGLIGSIFNIEAIPTWYTTINKPFFNPPNWIFAPVWTALFILMGIAIYLVWNKGYKNKDVKLGVNMFAVQLSLNILWSAIFFGIKDLALAFVEIIALWIAIALTMCHFKKVSKKAFWMMLPYLAWVSFAAVLNLSIWLLN
jgi:tryptophan-rich sensory protein